MKKTVAFRKFEERDIDFIYKCKNDDKLNSMIVGRHQSFSYEDAEKWVKNCMKGDRPDLRYWAICTNDEDCRIIGWVSLSEIDYSNKKAHYNGIVIGDKDYKDGYAWVEGNLFVLTTCFEEMRLNRVYSTCRVDHPLSVPMCKALFYVFDGRLREALFRNGKYLDLYYSSILSKEYFDHKNKGEYELSAVVKRLLKIIKTE